MANKMLDTLRHQGNANREAFGAGSSFGSVASQQCDCGQARELTSFRIDQTGAELRGLGSHFQPKILNLFATYMNLKFIAKEWFSLKYKLSPQNLLNLMVLTEQKPTILQLNEDNKRRWI